MALYNGGVNRYKIYSNHSHDRVNVDVVSLPLNVLYYSIGLNIKKYSNIFFFAICYTRLNLHNYHYVARVAPIYICLGETSMTNFLTNRQVYLNHLAISAEPQIWQTNLYKHKQVINYRRW